MKKEKPWCPRCDQGWIRHIHIYDLRIDGYVCEECNAFWFTKELIKKETFIGLNTFLDAYGIDDLINSYDEVNE